MLRIQSQITIQRMPNKEYPQRSGNFFFTTFNSIKIYSGWDKMLQTAEITLPHRIKHIYGTNGGNTKSIGVVDFLNKSNTSLFRNNSDQVNSNSTPELDGPFVMRGDLIQICIGYITNDPTTLTLETSTMWDGGAPKYPSLSPVMSLDSNVLFDGYVSAVNNISLNNGKSNMITIKCEDFMYYLQRIKVENKTWLAGNPNNKGYYDVQTMLEEMLDWNNIQKFNNIDDLPYATDKINGGVKQGNVGKEPKNLFIDGMSKTTFGAKQDAIIKASNPTGITEDATQSYIVGDIKASNSTVGMVLKELEQKYHLKVFMMRDRQTLHIGPAVYTLSDNQYNSWLFDFNYNIIENNLEFKDTSDVPAGCIVKCFNKAPHGATTKDGLPKTKYIPKTMFVGSPGGNMYDFYYYNTTDAGKAIPTNQQLADFGKQQLLIANYKGFRGSITILGYPYVRHGDTINLINTLYPENNGSYKVKAVEYKASVEFGLRQEVHLHMLIPNSNYGSNSYFDNKSGTFKIIGQ